MRSLLAGAALLLCAITAHADEIRLVASNAVKELVHELIPIFEKASGHHVQVTWGGTPEIIRLAEEGAAFDLVVISKTVVADLEARGKLLPGGSHEFVASAIGAAVAPGSPHFDVSTRAVLKQSLLDARSVVLSSGPSSLHLLALIDQMGIRDAVAPKLLRLAPGLSVGEAIAEGRGQLGFTQVSELLAVPGIERLCARTADALDFAFFYLHLYLQCALRFSGTLWNHCEQFWREKQYKSMTYTRCRDVMERLGMPVRFTPAPPNDAMMKPRKGLLSLWARQTDAPRRWPTEPRLQARWSTKC